MHIFFMINQWIIFFMTQLFLWLLLNLSWKIVIWTLLDALLSTKLRISFRSTQRSRNSLDQFFFFLSISIYFFFNIYIYIYWSFYFYFFYTSSKDLSIAFVLPIILEFFISLNFFEITETEPTKFTGLLKCFIKS